MAFYCSDRKLSELGEHDFDELLDADSFTPHANGLDHFGLENSMDNDWLDNFFDDPVLNDRMISDAIQPQNVQSEHSYSLAKGEGRSESPLNLKMESSDKELDAQLLNTANPNLTINQNRCQDDDVKCEPLDMRLTDEIINQSTTALINTVSIPCTTNAEPHTLLGQPGTIILTTTSPQPATSLLPAIPSATMTTTPESVVLSHHVNIKLEPMDISEAEHISAYESIGLPPTPPSSGSGSDSDGGGQSPHHSMSSSPLHTISYQTQAQALLNSNISFQPIPSTGMLLLSDEEKRTLISEGYPIPAKLPLTKQEEKNLKKIRRKIKNKISAQESRRKKKEYLESLEKRVEFSNQENTDLRRQVDQLENNNRSLTSQLQKLQTLVGKVTRISGASSSPQTSTCLMVFVLCFAVLLGGWSPISWSSVGYHGMSGPVPISTIDTTSVKLTTGGALPMGPHIKAATVDSYSTPNVRSRVLLSVKDDTSPDELEYGPHPPFSCRAFVSNLFSSASEPRPSAAVEPPQPSVTVTVDVSTGVNLTGEQMVPDSNQLMYPDASVTTKVVSASPPMHTNA